MGRWEIVQMEHLAKWILFTMREDMSAASGGTDMPYVTISNWWDGHNPHDCFDDEDDFKVFDEMGTFPRAMSGCKGIACWDPIENLYKVEFCQQAPQLIYVTAGSFLSTTDPVDCAGAQKMNREGDVDPPDLASVGNPFGCNAASEQLCPATWSAEHEEYVLIGPYGSAPGTDTDTHVDVTGSPYRSGCSGTATDATTTDVEEIDFDGTWLTVTVSGKKVTVALPTVTQDVVTSVGVNTTTKQLWYKTKTLTVLCAETESAEIPFHTGVAGCPS